MSRILITGASKGLGRATALELARRGHEVIATARKVETLSDLPVAQRLTLDVTNDASVKEAVAQAGQIDVLINNSADIALGPVESIPIEEVKHLYDTNVLGPLRLIQAVVPAMRERRSGTIVNISSVVGRVGFPLNSAYGSTKWALEAFSESLRLEVGHFGIDVVLIEPGAIGTGALDAPREHFKKDDPYLPLMEQRRFPPREQLTKPEAIASVVADAVESPQRQFRWPAGPDAIALLAQRSKLDDAAFETFYREVAKLDW